MCPLSLGPGQEGEGCPNREGRRFRHVMAMRHFVSGGKFIVVLNLKRLDQPLASFGADKSRLPDDFSDHSDGHDSQSTR